SHRRPTQLSVANRSPPRLRWPDETAGGWPMNILGSARAHRVANADIPVVVLSRTFPAHPGMSDLWAFLRDSPRQPPTPGEELMPTHAAAPNPLTTVGSDTKAVTGSLCVSRHSIEVDVLLSYTPPGSAGPAHAHHGLQQTSYQYRRHNP